MALLVVDMQNAFLQDRVEASRISQACEYINHVARLFRERGHAVVHVQDIEGMEADQEETYAFVPEVEVEPDDVRIRKVHSNAFWETDLEAVLRERGAGLVVVAGFAAEYCVLFTYQGAIERGFKAAMLQNGILSEHRDTVQAAYRDRHVVAYPVLEWLAEHSGTRA
ncbi:cysteine hydrolase [Cohnella nanjingensis]|uniref:Cysteine hydrolase n=2 Tax=Cohnella nanjingensis TaxID=1387779 RepID=A0A7X0RSC5_9BACL|nr:cysteine hydrolase [Cohnella nanjingensis]